MGFWQNGKGKLVGGTERTALSHQQTESLTLSSELPETRSSGGATLLNLPVVAIVDDDDSFRRATTSFIRSLGYAVIQFASAEAFLKSGRLHDTHCVISDVQMPGMNGLELQSKLIVEGPRLPIIFVTAFSEMRVRAQALAAGAIGFLDKPFSDEALIACLDKAVQNVAVESNHAPAATKATPAR